MYAHNDRASQRQTYKDQLDTIKKMAFPKDKSLILFNKK